MNRAWGPVLLNPELEPAPIGSHSLMVRGLPCLLAPGEMLDDELPLGWWTGVSGRRLSRPWRGQVAAVTAAVRRRERTLEAEIYAQQVKCSILALPCHIPLTGHQ